MHLMHKTKVLTNKISFILFTEKYFNFLWSNF